VIDALDPEGLLRMGAPSDEYAPEANILADLIGGGEPITPDLVEKVWVECFYPNCGLLSKELVQPLTDALVEIEATGE